MAFFQQINIKINMKKLVFALFALISVYSLNAQTVTPSTGYTMEQILKGSMKGQSGGKGAVLRLVPVTATTTNFKFAGQQSKTDDLMRHAFRQLPDGSFAIAVDGSMIGGGGGGGAVTSVNGQTGAVVIPTSTTNLGYDVNTRTISSSTGTGVVLPLATALDAGLFGGTDRTNFNQLHNLTGINAGTSNLGTFTGNTFTDNSSIKFVLQEAETAIQAKHNAFVIQDESAALGTTGTTDQINFTGAGVTATRSGNAVNVAITGASVSQMTGATSGTAGTAGTVPAPAAGEQNSFLKGDGTWGTVSATGLIQYATGGAIVTASGAGVTFVRTTASVWTFNVPAGVILQSFQIYSIAGENPGTNVTLQFNYTGNTLTNQNLATAYPPLLEIWNMQGFAQTVSSTGGAATSAFRPRITAASGGNLTTVSELGSAAGALETMIRGTF